MGDARIQLRSEMMKNKSMTATPLTRGRAPDESVRRASRRTALPTLTLSKPRAERKTDRRTYSANRLACETVCKRNDDNESNVKKIKKNGKNIYHSFIFHPWKFAKNGRLRGGGGVGGGGEADCGGGGETVAVAWGGRWFPMPHPFL